MSGRASHLVVGRILVAALLFCGAAPAAAQECFTFRTEKCPKKANVRLWRGAGADPMEKKDHRLPDTNTAGQQDVERRAEADRRAKAQREAQQEAERRAEAERLASQQDAARRAEVERATQQEAERSAAERARKAQEGAAQHAASQRRLLGAGVGLLSVGLAVGAAGGGLLAIDGQPTCALPDPMTSCPKVRDTIGLGAGLLAGAGVAVVTGAILLGVRARRGAEPRVSLWLPGLRQPLLAFRAR